MESGGLERGLYSLSHMGVHECSRCGECKTEREEGRAGKLFRFIPVLSLFFSFFLKTLKCCSFFWASQLREFTCVWARQGTRGLKPTEMQSPPFITFHMCHTDTKTGHAFVLSKLERVKHKDGNGKYYFLICISSSQGSHHLHWSRTVHFPA